MNELKIQKLFAAAQKEEAPEASADFARSVVSAIHRENRRGSMPSFFEQLSLLFPRLAAATVVIICLCVASELYFAQNETTTTADVQQAAEEWLFAAN